MHKSNHSNNNNSNNSNNNHPEAMLELAKDKLSGFVSRTIQKGLNMSVNKLINKAVPSDVNNFPIIENKINEIKDQIEQIQEETVDRVTKSVLNAAERAVYVIPIAGEAAAAVTSLDSAIAAGRNAWQGFDEIKDKINEIQQTTNELNTLSNMPNMPNIPNIPNIPSVPNMQTMPINSNHTLTKINKKQRGGIKTKKIINTQKHTRKSVHKKNKYNKYMITNYISKTKKNIHNIIDRTEKSISKFLPLSRF